MTVKTISPISDTTQCIRIEIGGAVQGVGFRPFLFRLADDLGLNGWVENSTQGVVVEAEGSSTALETFLVRIQGEKPSHSTIQHLQWKILEPIGYDEFTIRPSGAGGKKTTVLLPDMATCDDCFQELFDPQDRRYLYPFINCTHCGPRFSIIEDLPYDRANTTMKHFRMCDLCRHEYEDPRNRRFHAQPNACPVCGPHVELWDPYGNIINTHHEAILQTAAAIRQGKIVAVKGLGGFHLMSDARNEEVVRLLRARKHREEKPLAVLFPDLDSILPVCQISELEKAILLSSERPIILLKQKSASDSFSLAPSIAPHNPYLGIMLPYTPLHYLLMQELKFPIVATSGNLSDEPICMDELEALQRLAGIADLFLVHNRPICRHVDDSVVRVTAGREMILRRARGYAPLPIQISQSSSSILAVGGHLKNTIALNTGANVFISQHIGDLETEEAYLAFLEVIAGFKNMYDIQPQSVVCDLHPDYLSTKYAEQTGIPIERVQHHHAHVVSCMAENELKGPVLGVSWDGTGYGTDGTIWGGEFLLSTLSDFQRVAHLYPFPLPSGDKAIKEPRRTALGMLYEMLGDLIFEDRSFIPIQSFSPSELSTFKTMLNKRINSPITSSGGRLFDGVASLLGLRQQVVFEGQAAMELEFAIGDTRTDETYPYAILPSSHPHSETTIQTSDDPFGNVPWVIDWRPIISILREDQKKSISISVISAKFHNTISEVIIDIAKRIGEKPVVLSGGCFQNAYLTERTVRRLSEEGFTPYWHRQVPPNDGGISLGQIVTAIHRSR